MTSTDTRTVQERLRDLGRPEGISESGASLFVQAADRIDALEKAVEPFAGPETLILDTMRDPNDSPITIRCELGDIRRVRAALQPSDNEVK